MVVSCKRAAGMLMGILCLLTPVTHLSAQRVNTVYTLAGLVDSARHYLPVLFEKQALVRRAEAGIIDAKHAFLPRMNVVDEVSIGTANDLTGSFLPVPGVMHAISGGITAANNYQGATSSLASLYGEYELVNFGLKGATIDNARAMADFRQADLNKERYVVAWQVGRLYFEILKGNALLAVDKENIRRYEAIYHVSTALTGSGVNPGVDSSLAKAGWSRTRVDYNQAEANLHKLRQQLSYLTGIADPMFSLDTSGQVWKVMAGAYSGSPADTAYNPLMDYYTRQHALYKAELGLQRKSYLPKIIVGAGGWARGSSIQYNNNYQSLGEGLGYQRLNYTAGLGITYDLFSSIRRHDRLTMAERQVDAAGFAMQQQKLALHNDAMQAEEDIHAAEKNLHELPVQLQAASEAYQQKLAQYEAGLINLVDLTNASFVLYQAQTDYVTTMHAWYLANLNKAAVTGNLEPFIQTVK